SDLIVILDPLGIIGRKHNLRSRQLSKAGADPLSALPRQHHRGSTIRNSHRTGDVGDTDQMPVAAEAMARYRGGAIFLAVLETAHAREIAANTATEMGHLNLQGWKLIKQAAIDQPHGRHHERELPTQHASEVVYIHLRPSNDSR